MILSREGQTISFQWRVNLPKNCFSLTPINSPFFYLIASRLVHSLRLRGTPRFSFLLFLGRSEHQTIHIRSPIFLPQTTRPQVRATQLSITKPQWIVLLRSAPQEKRAVPSASRAPRTSSYCWAWQRPDSDAPQEKVSYRRHKTTCRNMGSIMIC